MLHIRLRLVEICDNLSPCPFSNPPPTPPYPPIPLGTITACGVSVPIRTMVVSSSASKGTEQRRIRAVIEFERSCFFSESYVSRCLRFMQLITCNGRTSASCVYSKSSACPSASSIESSIRSAVPSARCRAIQFIFRSQGPTPATATAPDSSPGDFSSSLRSSFSSISISISSPSPSPSPSPKLAFRPSYLQLQFLLELRLSCSSSFGSCSNFITLPTITMPRPKKAGGPEPKRRSRNGCWSVWQPPCSTTR